MIPKNLNLLRQSIEISLYFENLRAFGFTGCGLSVEWLLGFKRETQISVLLKPDDLGTAFHIERHFFGFFG